MDAEVVRELRMKRGSEYAPVADEHRIAVQLPSTSTSTPRSRTRGARMKTPGSGVVSRELDLRLEAPHLAPVCVPVDLEIDEPEMVAVEHDHPCAGTEHRPVE